VAVDKPLRLGKYETFEIDRELNLDGKTTFPNFQNVVSNFFLKEQFAGYNI
jgi:hypothetical protein